MANTLAPSGFQPSRMMNGSPALYAMRTFQIAYNNAVKFGKGDPVVLLNTGYIDRFQKTGEVITGILWGVEYVDPNSGQFTYYPAWLAPTLAATDIVIAHVIVDPMMLFRVQVSGTALALTNIGNNIDIVSGGSEAPNAKSGMSTCAVLASTAATTATLPFRIEGIVGLGDGFERPALYPTYDPSEDNNWVEVRLNTSTLTSTTGI